MENKLKDCPFCGGEKFTTHTQSGDERIGYNITHTITCSTCGCSKSARSKQDKNGWCVEGSDDVRKRAMNAWNTRAASTIDAELECARGDLKTAGQIIERYETDAACFNYLAACKEWPDAISDLIDSGSPAAIRAAILEQIEKEFK